MTMKKLKKLFAMGRADRELDAEMRFHLEKQIELNMAAGMSADEARRQAMILFGSVQQTKEAVRAQNWSHFMETLYQDARHALRMLRKSPGFTTVAVLTLAFGIGANTAIFSVINSVLFPNWGLHNPQQLVVIREATASSQGFLISIPDFEDYRRQQTTFEGLSLWISQSVNLTGRERPDRLIGAYVSDNFFSMLGVKAGGGRTFLPGEDQPGAQRVAVLSFSAWQSRFGSDPAILGSSLTLNNESYSIIGVLPASFAMPYPSDVYVTAQHHPSYKLARGTKPLLVFGRIKDGVSHARAVADLNTIALRLAHDFPENNAGIHIEIDTLREMSTGSLRTPLLLLLGAVALVLLIVCANLANLLLARGVARQRELAVRSALGAARLRLLRQLFSESLLLATLGGICGMVLAYGLVQVMKSISPVDLGLTDAALLDVRVLIFTGTIALLTGILFGTAPAFQFSQRDLSAMLAAGGRALGLAPRSWLRSALVVCQLAISVVLLVNASLLIRSLDALLTANPGFAPDHLLSMEYRLPANKYSTADARAGFHREVLDRVRQVPGVISAAYVQALPFSGNWGEISFSIPGTSSSVAQSDLRALNNLVAPEYFSTIGIPLLRGRCFDAHDDARSAMVVIVSHGLAQKFFPSQDPIGREIQFTDTSQATDGLSPQLKRAQIIGVVGDAKQISRREASRPQIYFSYAQVPSIFGTLVIRTAVDPMSVGDAVRNAVWSVDKNQPVWKIRTLDDLMQRDIAPDRFLVFLISAFGALALLLSAIGTYGMLSQAVHQRVRELGVRMALGATPGSIIKLVLLQGIKLAAAGGTLGLLCAFASTRLVAGLLFGVAPVDATSFFSGLVFMALVASFASYIPARRATKVDPMVALRQE
ncbi:MAG TPA: ABC transporter permease [Alphaproteobacteria bacterium]|nr:ABC transporter permease [Alphaproteobacteria bacterium]